MTPDQFTKLKKIRLKQQKRDNLIKKADKESKYLIKRLARKKKASNSLRLDQLKQNNPNELRFKSILEDLNISYIWQQPFYNIDRYICVDFYLPDHGIVIEIDGPNHDKQKEKDLLRTIYLKKVHGIKEVIRIKNKDLAINYNNVKDQMKGLLYN